MKNSEIWKRHPEYPFVEVSSFGDVRTLDRVVSNGKGTRLVKGRGLKQYCDNDGYMRVGFTLGGKWVMRSVHRLVAETFIPNPNSLKEINHRDNDRQNNNISNLEWCSHRYNVWYKENYGVSSTEALGRPVYAVNLSTLKVLRFKSQSEACRELGISQTQISKVVKGKYKTAGGYWFIEDKNKITKDKLREIKDNMQSRGVFAVNLETLEVLHFPSQNEASHKLGFNSQNINAALKGRLRQTHGYWFTYEDSKAVEVTRDKLGSKVSEKVKKLMDREDKAEQQ